MLQGSEIDSIGPRLTDLRTYIYRLFTKPVPLKCGLLVQAFGSTEPFVLKNAAQYLYIEVVEIIQTLPSPIGKPRTSDGFIEYSFQLRARGSSPDTPSRPNSFTIRVGPDGAAVVTDSNIKRLNGLRVGGDAQCRESQTLDSITS